MDRRKDPGRQLDPPAAFKAPRPAGPEGLIPPSHFQSRSAPPLVVQSAAPLGVTALSNWEAAELRRENQRLKDELLRWTTKKEVEEAGTKPRPLDSKAENSSAHHTLAMSQQAEVISHQLHEIQRLEAELATLRVASAQQELAVASRENALSHLQHELMELKTQSQAEAAHLKTELEEVRRRSELERDTLKEELEVLKRQSQLEAETLREELESAKKRHHCEIGLVQGELQRVCEEAETKQQKKEEKMQEQLQTVLREHQTELARLSEAHGAEVTTLKHEMQAVQQHLEAQCKDAEQLRVKKNALQKQLSAAEAELVSQNALLQQLKTYIGEQELRQPKSEQVQLINRVQQLEDENEALKVTEELLQVRLTSVSDILALQEMELNKKVQVQDPFQPETTQKFQGLLTRWREKVFALLVQLKSQELSHRDATKLLERKIKELEESAETAEQKVVLLLHNLEDKTAEVNMERVKNKTLQAEALRSNELARSLLQRAEADKSALQGLANIINRMEQQLVGQEEAWKAALSRLVSLGNRITFAAKRVDTIQGLVCQKIALARLHPEEKLCTTKSEEEKIQPLLGDLQVELQMLHEERDKLTMELKRGAQLVEKKVAEAKEQSESELKDMRETLHSLQEALAAKAAIEENLRREQEAKEKQLESASSDLKNSEEAAESLRQELSQLKEEYEKALQEKVTEIEAELRKDLSKMEKGLNEARREHSKAVVALRQAERQAARDKSRSEELAKLQESTMQQEITRLEGRLQELERDKNLLMVTLRQEGLLAQHRQNRLAAIQTSAGAAGKAATEFSSKESLFAVLDDLQVLGAAIMDEEEEGIIERLANADS